MLATLTRVKSPLRLSPDTLIGYIFGREVRRDHLSLLSHSCSPVSAAWRRRATAGIRDVNTSCTLCAKVRGNPKKRELSEKKLTRHFVDHRRVRLVAGSGGKGACSFHSEPRKEWGGPDGGNGGDGGSIIIKVADKPRSSLHHAKSCFDLYFLFACLSNRWRTSFRFTRQRMASQEAARTVMAGMAAQPTFVPVGTVVKEQGKTVMDLSEHGQECLAVFGGAGGKGNRFFLSNENRSPMTVTPGMDGEARALQLELRTMAHAGLVGFPNAGKSSLLRAISNAKPAVAAYPFTTLNPHVGIVKYRDHEQVAVADIPGIIRGAHLNRGLGISFLRHIERCRFLLFVLDLSSPEPWTQLQHLRYELEQYEAGLSQRPQAIIANKMDLPEAPEKLQTLKSLTTQRVIPVSALTGQNTEELILHLRELYDGYIQGEHSGEDKPTRW
ncbi:mitochondrial ribosome-associated GTPase 2 isoform X1 [Pempheris klunzingeri]|uniref:mitochondrial ribosome-associated GTPase 2 isoform X1 n=1 Tax=Pempheris klunzingeri TaxID=3127111 RepID=UPI003980EBCE